MYIRFGRIDSLLGSNNVDWYVSKVAKPLMYSDTINAFNSKWDSTTLILTNNSWAYGFNGYGTNILDWATGTDLFIGVKYQTAIDIIYGWVRVNIPYASNFVKNCYIKDYSTTGFVNSVNEIDSKKNNLIVFPNPTSTELNILNRNNEFNGSEVEIINYLGQPVFKQAFSNSIDVSKLPTGIYTLKINTQGNQAFHSKFVKQ